MACYIGLSGYSYKAWQGPDRFYSPDIKPTDFLRYYATRYRTVELAGVWYRLPSEKTAQAWCIDTPPHFIYAPKAHREITHIRRLKPEALPMLMAMLQRLEPLYKAGKLGPMLIQLPPNLKRDDGRLERFLGALPTTHQWAIEFRHESWQADEIERILRRFSVAWAAVETDEHEAEHRDTAPFRYVRLRKTKYGQAELRRWAERFQNASQQGQDCFVYCKHEVEGSPWIWADELNRLLNS
ncbi:MAG: DUF72 domain-containing protein [Nitrospira sp.]|nr:DUF72 domain-containing protein [Nitrospira sp.]